MHTRLIPQQTSGEDPDGPTNYSDGTRCLSAEIAAVMAQYALEPDEIEQLPSGYNGSAWRTRCGKQEFVMRRHRALFMNDARFSRQHSLVSIGGASGVFVAPLRTALGTTFARVQNDYYTLCPFVAGEPSQALSLADLASVGFSLANLHASPLGRVSTVAMKSSNLLAIYQKLLVRSCSPQLAGHPERTAIEAAFEIIGRAAMKLSALAKTPTAVLHGDLHPDNILLTKGRAVFIDYDFVHVSEPAYDVAIGLDSLCTAPDGTVDKAATDVFLQSYNRVRELSVVERAALPALIVRRNAFLFLYARTKHAIGLADKQCTSYWKYLDRIITMERLEVPW